MDEIKEILIGAIYGWKDYKDQGISAEDYVDEIINNLLPTKTIDADEDEVVKSCMNCGRDFYQNGINDLCHYCHTII